MTTLTETAKLTQTTFIQKHPLATFSTLAIVITWLISLPSLLFGMPFKPFQTAGTYGPFLAALIVSSALAV